MTTTITTATTTTTVELDNENYVLTYELLNELNINNSKVVKPFEDVFNKEQRDISQRKKYILVSSFDFKVNIQDENSFSSSSSSSSVSSENEENNKTNSYNILQQANIKNFDWKTSHFQKYFNFYFEKRSQIFEKWDFDEIENDCEIWDIKSDHLYIYIIGFENYDNNYNNNNNNNNNKSRAYVGKTKHLFQRFLQQNGIINGGPPDTKKNQGSCKIICFLKIPCFRNFSSENFHFFCKNARGWQSRCLHLLQIINTTDFEFKITKDIFDKNSVFYSSEIITSFINIILRKNEISDIIHKQINKKNTQQEKEKETLHLETNTEIDDEMKNLYSLFQKKKQQIIPLSPTAIQSSLKYLNRLISNYLIEK